MSASVFLAHATSMIITEWYLRMLTSRNDSTCRCRSLEPYGMVSQTRTVVDSPRVSRLGTSTTVRSYRENRCATEGRPRTACDQSTIEITCDRR